MSRAVILRRIGWSMLAGLLIGVVVSELSFYLLNDGSTRPPRLVPLDIPLGTAGRVARGQADGTLPTTMTLSSVIPCWCGTMILSHINLVRSSSRRVPQPV